jgi:uncharacterized protein (DUF58 family)
VNEFTRSLTIVGRIVAVVGPIALTIFAITGWAEFAVVGVGSVLALILGALMIARPQPIGVSRTLVPSKVTVGESSTGVISVRNQSRHRMGPRQAEDVLGTRVVQLNIGSLLAGQTREEHYVVPAEHRGLLNVGPVRLTRSDPLSLFKRVQGQGTVEQLWVRPRVHTLRSISAGWANDSDGPTSDSAPSGSAAFHTLREYQVGDDLRHVHWRTSARRGSLMVRHFVETSRTQEVVVLDPRTEFYLDETFESAVEVAASVCAACRTCWPARGAVAAVSSGRSAQSASELS